MRSVQTSNQSIMVIASVYAVYCVLYAPETDTKSKMRRINAAIYVYRRVRCGNRKQYTKHTTIDNRRNLMTSIVAFDVESDVRRY